MSEPFIGEIKMWAGNFAPRGFAFCDGRLLPIAQNTALFSIIGTTYGGDGRTTTALPDFQGRGPMHPGHGPGLPSHTLGQRGGVESVALTTQHMPSHTHQLIAVDDEAETANPAGQALATSRDRAYAPGEPNETMHAQALSTTGGTPHNNMQPFLAVSFIVAMVGLYPSHS